MKKLLMIVLCLMLVGCTTDNQSFDYDEAKLKSTVRSVSESWVAKDSKPLYELFTDAMIKAMPEEMMPLMYEQVFGSFENFENVTVSEVSYSKNYAIVLATFNFESGYITLQLTFNQDYKIDGLFVADKKNSSLLLPNETELSINQEKPLNGRLISVNKEAKTVVLIVSGSGPNDMDGSYMGTKVYRDIASGLAQHNIDSFRFNKRTFQYQADMVQLDYKISVEEEVINDVNAAIETLDKMGYENIVVLGHSLGGMLSLSIANNNDKVDAIISMAGSLRGLETIIYDQNMALIDATEDQKLKAEYLKQINDEMNAFKSRDSTKESTIIFGISNYYWDSLGRHTGISQVEKLSVPILVVQGKLDAQVYYDKDYPLWEINLKGKPATMIAYDGLDHRFMEKDTKTVDTKVMQDISEWILKTISE